jgi:hypothetical protein
VVSVDIDHERTQHMLKLLGHFSLQAVNFAFAQIIGNIVVRVKAHAGAAQPLTNPLRQRYADIRVDTLWHLVQSGVHTSLTPWFDQVHLVLNFPDIPECACERAIAVNA